MADRATVSWAERAKEYWRGQAPRPTPGPARIYITLEHEHSGFRRKVELLRYSDDNGLVWWPLCGQYVVVLEGPHMGRMLYGRQRSPWKIVARDLRRLCRHRPLSLYQADKDYT